MELQDTAQRITYALDEGDYTHEGSKLSQLGEVEVGDFEGRLYKDSFVEVSPNLNEAVKKVATGPAIGIIISTPYGNVPLKDTAFANVEKRHATVNVLGNGEYDLPLSDTNAAITANQALVVKAVDGKLDLSTEEGNSNAIALETIGASTGGYIKVFVNGPITVV